MSSFVSRVRTGALKQVTVIKTNKSKFSGRVPAENIHLFGFGRGGSTWIAEVLAQAIGSSPFIDEPFHRPKINFEGKNGTSLFGWKEFIENNDVNHICGRYFEALNNLKCVNRRLVSEHGKGNPFDISQPIVFKYIDRGYLLPYFIRRYSIRPIFLTRNPFAIYASRKKYGWPQATKIHVDSAQSKSSLAHLEALREKYPGGYSPAKVFAIIFSDQLRCFREIESKKLEISYEDFIHSPQKALQSTFSFLEVPYKVDGIQFQKPSSSSRGLAHGKEQLEKWKNNLERHEVEDIIDVLQDFGYKEFY